MSQATDMIDDILQDLRDTLEGMGPSHEGLRDYARLNIGEPARREIDAAIADYDRRVQYINGAIGELVQARSAIETLEADGYPTLPSREISDAALTDLRANAATIQAALAKFAPPTAISLGLTGGTPGSKP